MVQHIETVLLGSENFPATRLKMRQQSGELLRVHLTAGPRLHDLHEVRKVVVHKAQLIAAAENPGAGLQIVALCEDKENKFGVSNIMQLNEINLYDST